MDGLDKADALKAASALVASGISAADAAKAFGISKSTLEGYMQENANRRIGIGDTRLTATSNLIMRLTVEELHRRYSAPDAFAGDNIEASVKKANRVMRALLKWPDASDERISDIIQNAADFLAAAVAENAAELPDKVLLQTGTTVAPLSASFVDEDEVGALVIAEAVVKRVPARSDVEPELTDRARRILKKAKADVPQPSEEGQ